MNEGLFFLITVPATENKQLRFCMINIVLACSVNPRGCSPCHKSSQRDCFYLQPNAIQSCLFKSSTLTKVVFKIIMLISYWTHKKMSNNSDFRDKLCTCEILSPSSGWWQQILGQYLFLKRKTLKPHPNKYINDH